MQSKRMSFIEATCNTLSGFLISLGIWAWLIQPLFGISTSGLSDILITGIFTISSIIRSYAFRRVFNRIKETK